MSGLTRSLKYASFRAMRVVRNCLLMAVGFVFYFTLLDGEGFTLHNLLPRFPLMLMFTGNLMFMLYGMLDTATYMQLTLTYGCTRRNAGISTVYMHLLQMLVLEAVMAASCICIPASWQAVDMRMLCLMTLTLLLFGGGLSLVTGILIRRFGKVAYIIFVIFAALAGGMIGGLTGFSGGTAPLMVSLQGSLNLPVLLMAGIACYAVMTAVFYISIRGIEVRV